MWGSVLSSRIIIFVVHLGGTCRMGNGLHAATFGVAANNPLLTLAHRYWHGADIILLVALWNSGFAGALALFNQSTRMWFGMADAGALPKQLKYVHPKYKTPVGTVVTELVVALVAAGMLYGILYDPLTGFGFYAFALSFAIVLIYATASYRDGSLFLARTTVSVQLGASRRIPGGGDGALIWSPVQSGGSTSPGTYSSYGLWVFIGWAVVGVVLLIAMRLAGKEDWLSMPARRQFCGPRSPEELEHRPAV